jgi:hypothetical protein
MGYLGKMREHAKVRAAPPKLKRPNKETQAAMRESRALMKRRRSRLRHAAEVFAAIERKGVRR